MKNTDLAKLLSRIAETGVDVPTKTPVVAGNRYDDDGDPEQILMFLNDDVEPSRKTMRIMGLFSKRLRNLYAEFCSSITDVDLDDLMDDGGLMAAMGVLSGGGYGNLLDGDWDYMLSSKEQKDLIKMIESDRQLGSYMDVTGGGILDIAMMDDRYEAGREGKAKPASKCDECDHKLPFPGAKCFKCKGKGSKDKKEDSKEDKADSKEEKDSKKKPAGKCEKCDHKLPFPGAKCFKCKGSKKASVKTAGTSNGKEILYSFIPRRSIIALRRGLTDAERAQLDACIEALMSRLSVDDGTMVALNKMANYASRPNAVGSEQIYQLADLLGVDQGINRFAKAQIVPIKAYEPKNGDEFKLVWAYDPSIYAIASVNKNGFVEGENGETYISYKVIDKNNWPDPISVGERGLAMVEDGGEYKMEEIHIL